MDWAIPLSYDFTSSSLSSLALCRFLCRKSNLLTQSSRQRVRWKATVTLRDVFPALERRAQRRSSHGKAVCQNTDCQWAWEVHDTQSGAWEQGNFSGRASVELSPERDYIYVTLWAVGRFRWGSQQRYGRVVLRRVGRARRWVLTQSDREE